MPVTDRTACRLFDIQRFSIHDGPGIRTTVFFSGCPLRCLWCQNPEAFDNACGYLLSPEAVIAEALKDKDYYDVSGGGLTVSGGEPLSHVDPVCALLTEARRHGLHTTVQTSAAVPPENIEAVAGLADLFQLDLKHMAANRHRELTGVDCARIHENAALFLELGAAVQFRMPLLPGLNDEPENLDAVIQFLRGHGAQTLHLVPYHRLYLDKYAKLGLEPRLPSLEPPSTACLARVRQHLETHGVTVEVDA